MIKIVMSGRGAEDLAEDISHYLNTKKRISVSIRDEEYLARVKFGFDEKPVTVSIDIKDDYMDEEDDLMDKVSDHL